MAFYIGEIIKLLCEEGLMKNTTIIFYGDHGDDYFTHGNHEGLTHAIEPYANLIHTPFWIYDNRLVENGECKDLICTIDIKNIVEMLLKMPDIRFSWHDLHIPLQKYVFARNAYAAQPERSGSFNKGYCVVDGKFLLMASNNGLELYDIEMDVECHNNLLNYFIYKDKLLHLNQELNSTMRFHYRYIFNMNTIRQIRQVFYYYRERLYEEVQKLYSIAECKNEIKELCFEKIQSPYTFFWFDGYFVLVVNNLDSEILESIIDKMYKRTKKRMPSRFIHLGIGTQMHDLHQVILSYKRAKAAVTMAEQFKYPMVLFEEMGVYQILFSIEDKRILIEMYQKLLQPLIDYDQKHHGELEHTLYYYLLYDGSQVAMAKNLYMHRNTINYRMIKIKELLNCMMRLVHT
mgnify:CR=1 FL=1